MIPLIFLKIRDINSYKPWFICLRQLKRKLPAERCKTHLTLFERIFEQKRADKNKIYSLDEPEKFCIGKGHKKYEFGINHPLWLTKIAERLSAR